MKKYVLLVVAILSSLLLVSCNRNKKADIVTTLFPHYDIAKQISQDKLTVSIITPFGGEVHDYEPSAKQIVAINESKLFIFTSHDFEVWVKGLINQDLNSFNTYEHVTIDSDDIATNMHYWTDPFIFIEMIEVILEEIVKIDLENETFYRDNAANYIDEITEIHELFLALFENQNDKTIYFAGHNALGGFSARYGINIVALIDDFKPEADQTIKDIEKLIAKIKVSQAAYLFVEELIEPRVAKTIQNELEKEGLDIILMELHGFHNITKQQDRENIRYADLYRQNYEHIRKAFN